VQDPMTMGYQGVMTLVDHLNGKTVPRRVETAVTLVTPETMGDPAVQRLLHPPLERYLK